MQDTDREWSALPLEGDRLHFDTDLPDFAGAESRELGLADGGGTTRARLLRSAGPEGTWVLLTEEPGAVRVNGLPLPLGMRVLRDRDAIRLGARGTVFFSLEALPRVVEFAGPEGTRCARCKLPIHAGYLAVACPGCGLWHHSGPDKDGVDRPCWTYADTCAFCPQPTRLDGSFTWSPEDL
jgi:hypothetical protein